MMIRKLKAGENSGAVEEVAERKQRWSLVVIPRSAATRNLSSSWMQAAERFLAALGMTSISSFSSASG